MRHARDLLNCWLVAMWFWWHVWAEYLVAVRRSRVWWFVPPKHKRWTVHDFVLLFRGRYRVTEFRAVRVQWFDSRAEVLAWQAWRNRSRL